MKISKYLKIPIKSCIDTSRTHTTVNSLLTLTKRKSQLHWPMMDDRKGDINLEKLLVIGKLYERRPGDRSPMRRTKPLRSTLNTSVRVIHPAEDRQSWRRIVKEKAIQRDHD